MMLEPPLHGVIGVENLTLQFDTKLAIQNLSFSVRKGERVAILGRTGSGKSTLLNLLVGYLRPTSGSIRVTGLDPYLQHRELQGRFAMAFQTPSLVPWLTVIDNARVGLDIMGYPKKDGNEAARKWLKRVQLEGVENFFPNQLSGGMRQRVSLARAFAIEPTLLMLDESFSALDEVTARTLREDFKELCEERRTTALIVTHSIEEAFFLATRVLVFASPAKILAEYDTADYNKSPEAYRSVREEIHGLIGVRKDEPSGVLKSPKEQMFD